MIFGVVRSTLKRGVVSCHRSICMEKKSIKEWRIIRGLTQQKLAAMADVSLSTIVESETFRKTPNMRNAVKIAKALQVELSNIRWTISDE
jgi:DNA-binding XRE family transcriptional regulator